MEEINYKELRIGNLIYVTDTLTNLAYQLPTRTNIHNLMSMTGYDKRILMFNFLNQFQYLKYG